MRVFSHRVTSSVVTGLAALLISGGAQAQLSPENAVSCVEGATVPIAYGDHTLDCEIDFGADLDVFTFQGTAGDEIRIVFRGFDAVVELRDPFDDPLSNGGEGVNEWVLPESGPYELRVFDDQSTYTGPYRLQLESAWPLDWAAGLSYDDTPFADGIDPDTDADWFIFKGRSGTQVGLTVEGLTNHEFGPAIELLSPDGTSLGTGSCGSPAGPCSFFRDFDLTQDGNHYIEIHDSARDDSGDYEISLQCLFGDCPLGYYIRSVGFTSLIEFSWEPTSDPDATFDVVKGDLDALRASGGDFSVSVTDCISIGNVLPFADTLDDPDPGEGFFYVVRAVQEQVGAGSYDTGRASQSSRYGGRDLGPLGILGSPNACVEPPLFVPEAPPGDIHMAAGQAGGSSFDVEIRVTDVADFYGAAFHVSFDPASAQFTGYDPTGSFLLGHGAGEYFNAATIGPGEVAVSATLLGQVAGVPNGNGLLITLSFVATAATSANPYTFDPEASRLVNVCPTPDGPCPDIAAALSWTGGALTVP